MTLMGVMGLFQKNIFCSIYITAVKRMGVDLLTEETMAARKRASKLTGKPMETRGRPPVTAQSALTRKQELFVKELVSKDGQITLREAAINAGYSVGSATPGHMS